MAAFVPYPFLRTRFLLSILFASTAICLTGHLRLAQASDAQDGPSTALDQHDDSDSERVRIVLAGDSTVAETSGWGDGFTALMSPRGECINFARGGRSSRSFRAEGWWKKCLEQKPDYILIQFGHNDQPGKGPKRESAADGAFRDHLRQYVDEAQAAGIRPVLITSLTRRAWNSDGTIRPTLAEYAEATAAVAREKEVPLIDLHRLSIEQCENFGPTAFRAFEPMKTTGADHTHLNNEGSKLAGRLVAQQLVRVVPELADCFETRSLRRDALDQSSAANQKTERLELVVGDDGISVTQNKNTVLKYVAVSPPVPEGLDPVYHRSGVLHPVASPDGKVVTAMFPADHPHQDGVFSAWVKTTWNKRPIDFWNLAGGTGRVLHQRVVSTFQEQDAVGFEVDLVHRADQQPVVDVLRERWRITVHPTDGTHHCFDLQTHQRALTSEPLLVQEYHYGGVAVRGPVDWVLPRADADGSSGRPVSRMLNNNGSDRIAGNHEHAKWVAMTGQLDGESVSIAVLCHDDNFRAPQAARLHPTKPYFVYAPCVDGEFMIDQDHPYQARYRYLITDDPPDSEWLNQQWDNWHAR